MPAAGISLIGILVSAFLVNKFRRSRCILMVAAIFIAIMGVLLVRLLPTQNKWGRLVGIWFFAIYSTSFPIALSLVASNFNGYTKKSTVGAILFIGYCAGNIAGPFCFKPTEAPEYNSAFAAIVVCLCVAAGLIIVLRFYLDWENKHRDCKQGVKIEAEPKDKVVVMVSEELLDGAEVDISDWKNHTFRYYI